MTRREEATEKINGLFPPDSEYPDTAKKGRELLDQAKRDVQGWRVEPTEVLVRFAQLCMTEDNRQSGIALWKDRQARRVLHEKDKS